MSRKRSLSAYRAIDLMLWAAMLIVFEGVILRAARSKLFADQVFTASLAASVTCIVYMRWGFWGGLHAALAGFVFAAGAEGGLKQTLIYTVGNLLSLAVVPVMNRIGRERIRQSVRLSLLCGAAVLLLMQTGRAASALVTGASMRLLSGFYLTDSLSAVFTLTILWIVRRQDGIFEDQRHYLRRIQEEAEKERMERE